MEEKFLIHSGFDTVLKKEREKRQTKEASSGMKQIDPKTLVMHTPVGVLSFEQGWRYVAGLMSGEIR